MVDAGDLGNRKTESLRSTLVQVAAELASNPRTIKLPTMRELAKKAGVAPGAAYRHFASQDDLYIEVIRFLFDELEQSLNEAITGLSKPEAQLKKFAQAYVNWGLSNPGSYQLLFETTDEIDMPLPNERPGLHLITQLAALLSKDLKPNKASTQSAIQLWVSLHGLISLRLHKTGMNWQNSVEKDVDQTIKTFWAR